MKHNDSTKDGRMNTETRSKLRAAIEALSHRKAALMAVGGNPYESLSDEELIDLQALVCALASASQAECNSITDELIRRQQPPA